MKKRSAGIAPLLAGMVAILASHSSTAKPHAQEQVVPLVPLYPGARIVHEWIPMKDGVRLAVNLFMPEKSKSGVKFPAILEYLPYRKDDWAAQRDYGLYSYFCRYGFVGARVDIRGTGSSEGVPPDREYSEQEQEDGMEVIAWLARQPWSSGNVGMMGISWGGFNSIQMAMRHPPALKAIIAVDATGELFHDDIHYIDGMMHVDEFELGMDQEIPMTATPDFPLDDAHLAPRFDATPWFLLYLHEQRDGPFWRRTSLRPHYERMQIPVFLIAGFLDGYRDTVPRFFEHVKVPVKALVGPWNHTYPHDAVPGPAIEWRTTAVRWFDHWLKGIDNGIMQEPRLTVYMRHWYPPDPRLKEVPGEWRGLNRWPLPNQKEETMYFRADHTLGAAASVPSVHQLKYIPSVGGEAGFWWGDLTNDQRPADAFSLVYDSAPLDADIAILGRPGVSLRASATAPLADWFVRLSDVAPDGAVTLITGAGISGAQRESSADPSDLVQGKMYSLRFKLHFTSWVFPRGHRIRTAVSNALWPMIWPTHYSMTTSLELGGIDASRIVLPVVPLSTGSPAEFPPPSPAPRLPGMSSGGEGWPGTWTTERDEIRHSTKVYWKGEEVMNLPWGKEKYREQLTYGVADAHPESSSVHGEADTTVELKDRTLLWRSFLDVRSDASHFFYHYKRELEENGRILRKKTWNDAIPRDHQ